VKILHFPIEIGTSGVRRCLLFEMELSMSGDLVLKWREKNHSRKIFTNGAKTLQEKVLLIPFYTK